MDKRRKGSLKEITYPSLPPASPHRLGHYSGLHPEDQPYQSGFIAVQRPVQHPMPHTGHHTEESDDHDVLMPAPRLPRVKEPERILLPHVPLFVEDVPTLVKVDSQAQQELDDERENRQGNNEEIVIVPVTPRVPRTRKLSQEQLYSFEHPVREVPPAPRVRITGPIGPIGPIRSIGPMGPVPTYKPNHLVRVLLTLSAIFFLLASSILAFIFVRTRTAAAVPILNANPSILRVHDTLTLVGNDFTASTVVRFTHDENEPILDTQQQPMTALTDSKGDFSVQIAVPPSWLPANQPVEHAIHATDDAQELSRTTTITVQPTPSKPPRLQLSQSTLDLGDDRAGTTSSKQVTLINAGGDQLTWQPSSDSSWLTVSPTDNSYSFSGRSLVNVTVNRSHLVPKSYVGHITFSQTKSSTFVKLTVTMGVKAAPAALNVSPSSLTFSATSTQAAPMQVITLQNSGGQTLNWQASATTNDGARWLYINQMSGRIEPGSSETFDVTIQAQQLVVGSYQGTITLSGGANASLPIFLTVVAPGALVVSSPSLTFEALTGQGATTQSITLQNSGGQSLDWSANPLTSNATNWLSIAPTGGTILAGGQTTLKVTVDSATLIAGAYQGMILVNSGGSSKQIPVSLTLTVPPAAAIGLQSSALNFTTPEGNNPLPQDFTITNTGNAPLNWIASESNNGATFAPLSLTSGSLAPQAIAVISVAPSVANAAPSTLTSTITIADSDTGTSVVSQTLPVSITITSQAAIGVAPQTNFSLDTTNNTQVVTISNSGTATLNWTASIQLGTPAASGAVGGAAASVTPGTGTPIAVSTASAGTPLPISSSWLSVDVSNGTLAVGQNATITITCNGSGLTSGTYQGQITISDSDAGTVVPSRTIYVTFIV